MKHFIYHRLYIPVLVNFLKFCLWGMDWVLPESIVERAYDVISDYYGKQYCLPERTATAMSHLPLDQQEQVFNMVWEMRRDQKAVDDCIEAAEAKSTASA